MNPPKKLEGPLSALEIMPAWNEIPDEYRNRCSSWGCKLMGDWFFYGAKLTKIVPKHGIDKSLALSNIDFVIRSWDPKHEHKTAAVAYMLESWFEKIEWEIVK